MQEVKRFDLTVDELRPIISWPYFDHAWGMTHQRGREEYAALRRDADALLDSWRGSSVAHALLMEVEANADGDDIVLPTCRLPMLRQQTGVPPMLCLADFVRPASMDIKDRIGLFCTTVDADLDGLHSTDPYQQMLAQTLADRLAEATAEYLSTQMSGIRPAVGYPSMPDMSLNFLLESVMQMSQIGISLTSSGMMIPHASVSGIILPHPQASYFSVGPIGADQLQDYASRRGYSVEEMKRFIGK